MSGDPSQVLHSRISNMLWRSYWLGLAALVAGITVYVVCVLTYTQMRWRSWLRDVPGPARSSWFMGNLRSFLNRNTTPICREWSQTYGGVVRFWGMFGEPRLMITDPVAMDYVLRKRERAFPKLRLAKRLIGSVMGEGLLVAEGDVHRRQKRAILPGFQPRAIKRLAPVFSEHALNMANYIRMSMGDKEEVMLDVFALLNAATMDALGHGALGVQFGALAALQADPHGSVHASHPIISALESALQIVMNPTLLTVSIDIAAQFFPILEHIPMGLASQKFRHRTRVLFDAASQIVDDAKERIKTESEDSTPDILATLLRANENAQRAPSEKNSVLNRNVLTDAELQAQVSTFIFAGHETTAAQLAWLMLFLAQDPLRQDKLRNAIYDKRKSLGLTLQPHAEPTKEMHRSLSADELDDIPYLEWCLRESLRVLCPVHTTSRLATQTEFIPVSDGRRIQVHRGMTVMMPLTSITTSESYCGAEPDSFIPERWEQPLKGPALYPAHNGLAFLFGPRACIGSAFSFLEMKAFVASILPAFHIEWDGREIVPKLWVVARPFDVQHQVDSCVLKIRRISGVE